MNEKNVLRAWLDFLFLDLTSFLLSNAHILVFTLITFLLFYSFPDFIQRLKQHSNFAWKNVQYSVNALGRILCLIFEDYNASNRSVYNETKALIEKSFDHQKSSISSIVQSSEKETGSYTLLEFQWKYYYKKN